MSFAIADRLAKALLYEGYCLYPYRKSALKNQQRWTFGGLFPEGGVGEPSSLRSEFLVRGDPTLELRLRFLQLMGEQAVERELRQPGRFEFPAVDGGLSLSGELRVEIAELRPSLHRVSVEVKNLGPYDQPHLRSFASPHVAFFAPQGELLSMTDPPDDVKAEAAACRNEVTWPVLLHKQLLLCSPIILEDHPKIAPESAIDLFDSAEIDEMLVLRILTLTDEEKLEARRDPRVAAVFDRIEGLSDVEKAQLHGRLQTVFRRGSRVRIKPLVRADVLDVALVGQIGTVADVENFVDGTMHYVVTIDEDPAAHRFFFRHDELEAVAEEPIAVPASIRPSSREDRS